MAMQVAIIAGKTSYVGCEQQNLVKFKHSSHLRFLLSSELPDTMKAITTRTHILEL